MNYLRKIGNLIPSGAGVIASIFLIVVMLVVFINIVLRLFGSTLLGTYEWVEYFMALAVMFAIVHVVFKNGHVAVDMLVSRLKKPVRKVLAIFEAIIGTLIWVLMAWAALLFANQQWLTKESTFTLGLPIYITRYVFFVCLVIISCFYLIRFYRSIFNKSWGV